MHGVSDDLANGMPHVSDDDLAGDIGMHGESNDLAKHSGVPSNSDDLAERWSEYKIATANVKTLSPAELRRAAKVGLDTNQRIEYLDGIFNNNVYDVVFIQESCLQVSSASDQVNYVACTSGATSEGYGGVEV